MSRSTRLRMNVSTRSLSQVAGLVSNSVILAANAYLLGSSLALRFRERKRERTSQTLEMGAQIANAVAGLTKVVVETIENGQRRQVL